MRSSFVPSFIPPMYKIVRVFTNIPRKTRRFVRHHFGSRRRARAKRFHNCHQGERCFIIGNGPSLNAVDLHCLKDEYTFGVNGIFHKHRQMGFKPSYYIAEDFLFVEQHAEEINQIDYAVRFFPERYMDSITDRSENTHFLLFDWSVFDHELPQDRKPFFSTDITEVIGIGGSVTFVALQLAFYMGFDPVYLIGIDHNVLVPPDAKKVGKDRYRVTGHDPNHFYSEYKGTQDFNYPNWEIVNRGFSTAREVFERHGRRVYNATVGGKLELFERVEFNSLFLESDLLTKTVSD